MAVTPFSLLVKPAGADCNLRCRYCFYLDKVRHYPSPGPHRMTDAVLESMIRSFLATDQNPYAFGWQGGEPTLMGLPFFERVTALQRRHAHQGALVSNALQTNGTLIDDAFARHLSAHRFLVGISVDGPAEIHDGYRCDAGGGGSHAAVMRGLGTLKRNGVEFNVLTLVSRANVGKPELVYRYLCDQGVLYHQYVECVEFDGQGAPMPFAVSGPEWGEFLCRIYDLWIKGDTHRVSVRLFDAILARWVDGVANVCPMGRDCRQYLVVEHQGDVYPCDFFVDPSWRLGNLMTDSWDALQRSPVYETFGRRKTQWNEACEACEYRLFCAGDCPKNRTGGGCDPGALSHLCEGWRMFFAHSREGFRRLAEEIRRTRMDVAGTGRNDPCPCGSGRKYKKCCGRTDWADPT